MDSTDDPVSGRWLDNDQIVAIAVGVAVAVVCLAIGYTAGRYYGHPRVVERPVEKIVELPAKQNLQYVRRRPLGVSLRQVEAAVSGVFPIGEKRSVTDGLEYSFGDNIYAAVTIEFQGDDIVGLRITGFVEGGPSVYVSRLYDALAKLLCPDWRVAEGWLREAVDGVQRYGRIFAAEAAVDGVLVEVDISPASEGDVLQVRFGRVASKASPFLVRPQ